MRRTAIILVTCLALAVAVLTRGQAAAPAQGILYTRNVHGSVAVWEAPASGGDGRLLIGAADQPAWAPDGGRFAFIVLRAPDTPGVTDVATAAADGSDVRVLTTDGGDAGPTWSPDSAQIAFARAGGQAAPQFASSIWSIAKDGSSPRQLTHPPTGSADYAPAWSPDGSTIAFTRTATTVPANGPVGAIWTVDVSTGVETRLTPPGSDGAFGAWSPDGTRIAFLSGRDHDGRSSGEDETRPNAEVYVMHADGSSPRRITRTRGPEGSVVWSASGERLLYSSAPASEGFEPFQLVLARRDGGCPTALTEGAAWHLNPSAPPTADLDGQSLRCAVGAPVHPSFIRSAAALARRRVHGGRPVELALARTLVAGLGTDTTIRSLAIGRPPAGHDPSARSVVWLRFVVAGTGTRNAAAAVRPSWEPWLVADRYAAAVSGHRLRPLLGITIHYLGSGRTVATTEAARNAPSASTLANETLSADTVARALRSTPLARGVRLVSVRFARMAGIAVPEVVLRIDAASAAGHLFRLSGLLLDPLQLDQGAYVELRGRCGALLGAIGETGVVEQPRLGTRHAGHC